LFTGSLQIVAQHIDLAKKTEDKNFNKINGFSERFLA
jgi:hypothetical protein